MPKRTPIWLPYTNKITIKKNNICFEYKGGALSKDITEILSIMFYGSVDSLNQEFVELCTRYAVPICIHRRNMAQATWITPSISPFYDDDILSKQIDFRNSIKKSNHVCKKILDSKFKSMEWLVNIPWNWKLHGYTQKEMINIEALHARTYWQKYYKDLGFGEYTRRSENKLSAALDASSKFVSGIFLRWIIYHKLSPYHGFIHIPNSYPALVYDLMESYRGYIDKAIYDRLLGIEHPEEMDITAISLKAIEAFLDTKIYTEPTRQIVSFQELFHGSILALRAYLRGDSKGLIIPMPTKPNGGRPVKAGYKLYGRSAGPTDFWEVAKNL